MIYLAIYIIGTSAAVFALIWGADKAGTLRGRNPDCFPYVFCGIFWPVAFLPMAAYLAARWFIGSRK